MFVVLSLTAYLVGFMILFLDAHIMKRIFEVSPDELLDEQNLEQLKEELAKRLKIRRDLRETKHQQELFDPSKPQGKKK